MKRPRAMPLPRTLKMTASLVFFVLCFRVLYFLTHGVGRRGGTNLLLAPTSSSKNRTSEQPSISKNARARSYLDGMFDANELDAVEPRVYRSWPPGRPLPCHDDVMRHQRAQVKPNNFFRERENNKRGFLYMRPPKCASTTVGGVNMRIARNEWARRHPAEGQGDGDNAGPRPEEPARARSRSLGAQAADAEEDTDAHRLSRSHLARTNPRADARRRRRRRYRHLPSPYGGGVDEEGDGDPWRSPRPDRPRMCDLSFSHGGKAKGRRFRDRSRDDSYLWTIIREPTARHVSFFWFWGVSANHRNTSDESFQEFLFGQAPDYYFTFLSPRFNLTGWRKQVEPDRRDGGGGGGDVEEGSAKSVPPPPPPGTKHVSTMSRQDQLDEARYVLNEYDYIGITERLDESLVVLGMLLGVPMGDLLYYSAKASDNFYIDPDTKNRCIVLQPSVVSPGMKEFFASQAWKDRVYSDAVLYRAAERSLDRTIDALGRDEVEARVRRLRDAQKVVVERCRGKIKMECEVEGEPPNKEFDCLHHDMGCGMTCLDQVAAELGLQQ